MTILNEKEHNKPKLVVKALNVISNVIDYISYLIVIESITFEN